VVDKLVGGSNAVRRRTLAVANAAGGLNRRLIRALAATTVAADVSRHNKTDTCDDDERCTATAARLVATRMINGQPGHGVVGPGWLQLGVSNCPFVTRTAVWVHCAGIRLSLEHYRPPAL
jgi:hypothetical protein